MPFTSGGRRRKALATPFPDAWRALVSQGVAAWRTFNDAERERLEELIRLLLADKGWEASRGFELTEEIRVVIAALAAIPILGLDYDYYHGVTAVIVTPKVVDTHGSRLVGDGILSDEPMAVIGLASSAGPVLIAWEDARRQGRRPGSGNVVYHEFAHALDMLDGSVDGTPPLESQPEYERWVEVCNAEYLALRNGTSGGLLDIYGATDPGEFFAVVTETFFDRPAELLLAKPDLYAVLAKFYGQDPAERERRIPRA